MANLKEIVTKAVIGKTKKKSVEDISFSVDMNIDTILGCWIINHEYKGEHNNNSVNVYGTYDLNLWYSYDNNTKTSVLTKQFNYNELLNVKTKSNDEVSDIIVRALKSPTVSNAEINNGTINLKIEKEIGVELVGDTKVRINVLDDFDDYEEEDNNIEINEDYLNDVNQK